MEQKNILERLKDCIVNLDMNGVQQACEDALTVHLSVQVIIDSMSKGMDIVGQRYESKDYFLAELITAGEVMKGGLKILEPHIKPGDVKTVGKVVIGTVRGDVHDIGKNIVVMCLRAAGFEVIDIGIDVSAEEFVETVRRTKPDIVGLSALLTITMPEMRTVIKELEKAGLRNKVKVIVGGGPLALKGGDQFAKEIGADAFAGDAVDGVNTCKKLMGTNLVTEAV